MTIPDTQIGPDVDAMIEEVSALIPTVEPNAVMQQAVLVLLRMVAELESRIISLANSLEPISDDDDIPF